MKKSMSVCKRLLAMLLVFAMVIGYIPGLSFATDSAAEEQVPEITGAKVVTPFLVTVTRSEYKDAAPEESAAASDEVPGEEPVEPETAYTYTAALTVADQIVAEADVKFAWVYGDNGENIIEGACAENISGQFKEIGLQCTYDGITLTEKLEEADFAETAEVKIPLRAEMKLGEAKLGAPAAAPAAATSQNFVGQWTVANWNESHVVDGYVLNGADTAVRLATLQLRGEAAEGEKPVVYLEQEWMVKIVPVQFTASLEVEEGKREWYNTVNAVVTITGDAPVKDSSFIKETVLVDGMEFAANWTTKDEGNTWQSAKITLTETGNHSIAACNTKFEFDIDTVRPTVQIENAYYTTVNGVQITVLEFSYTVGKSGLEKIIIYDGDKIINDDFNPNAPGSIVLGWIENPRVVVLGRNGLSSEVNPVPQGALTVTVEGPAEDTVLGTIGDEIYAPAGAATVVVEGAAEAGAYMLDIEKSVITAKDQSGNDIQVGKWSYANGKWTASVTLAGGLSELSASVVDGKNRKADCSFNQKYAVDTEAPVITVSRDVDPVNTVGEAGTADYVEFYNHDVTYTFTISDLLLGDAENYITYALDGREPVKVSFVDGVASVKVVNGQRLTGLTVCGVDASGNVTRRVVVAEGSTLANTWTENTGLTYACNAVVDTEAPVVSAVASGNVQAFYTAADGRVYAVLRNNTPVVTLTVTVKDKNLNAGCLTAEGAAWEISFNAEEGLYEAVAVFQVEVPENATDILKYAFTIQDLANWSYGSDLMLTVDETSTVGLVSGTVLTRNENGGFEGELHVDRRKPSTGDVEVPVIELVPSIEPTVSANGNDLFSGAFKFTMDVSDTTNGNTDSGIRYVEWSITDDNGVVKKGYFDKFNTETNLDGHYEIPVELNVAEGESNEVRLQIWVKNHALNNIGYAKVFGVDTKAPEIEAGFDKNLEETEFYDGERTLNVTVKDLNLKDAKLYINGELVQNPTAEADTIAFVPVTFDKGGVYNIKIEAVDLAGNAKIVELPEFIVDMTPPEVQVTKTVEEGKGRFQSIAGVDYYNGKVTYTVTVADQFLSAASGVATLTYTFENGTANTVALGDANGWTLDEEKGTYSCSFTVVDGQVLTGMTLHVVDNAGNPMTAVSGTEPFESKDGIWSYTGNDVVVDETAPEITVTKDNDSFHTYQNRDYYDKEVTYTIQVTDNFLNANVTDTLSAVAVFTDGSTSPIGLTKSEQEPAEGETALAEKHADLDTYTGSITLNESKVLKTIEIRVKDNSGNTAVFPSAAAAKFEQAEDGTWFYKGNPIVVDKTAPTAKILFSEEVDSFYMKADGTIYAVLKTPVNLNSGETAQDEQHVEVTIQVTDHNLAIDNEYTYGVKAGTFGWTGEPAVNTESTVTYTAKSEKVAVDGTAVFKIDVQIADLAGNFLVKNGVKVEGAPNKNGLGKTVPAIPGLGEGEELTEGKIAFTVNVDRRRPTSGKDEVPTIVIDPVLPENIKRTETASGLPLYNGAFSFDLYVEDKDSGINYLKWNLVDDNKFVMENTADLSGDALNAEGKYNIPVELPAEASESNEVVLTIESMDNVGNIIKYEYDFGVDTLAPRIEYAYTYDKTEAKPTNVNFYNKDVTLTVSITDLNLDESYLPESFINIIRYSAMPKKGEKEQPVDSTWNPADLSYQRVGDTITYTFPMTFVEDGIYGVTTDVQDLANYKSDEQAIDNVFILDKTAPAVRVAKTVKEGKRLVRTVDGVDYHDGEVTYIVTIADQFLSAEPGQVNVATLTYTFEDGTTETVQLGEDTKWTAFQFLDGKTYYQYEFTVTDGQVLTDMTLQAVDNANNPMTEVLGDAPFADEDKDGIWTYTGNDVVVDETDPVVTVTMEQKPAHTYEIGEVARDYYDEKVTYTITVKDNFMNEGVAQYHKVTYSIMDDQGNITTETKLMTAKPGEGLMVTEDTFEFEITIEDGQVLEALEFQVEDNSGNNAVFPEAEANQFTKNEDGAWVYTGNPIVVDLTAPAAELKFSDNVDAFYTNGNTVYVILKEPVVGNSGVASTQKAQTVTMTLTVKDRNLVVDNADKFGVKDLTEDSFKWVGETGVNKESTITYTAQSVDVAADGRQTFEIDLQIIDLAGHALLSHTSENEQKLVRVSTGNEAPALGGNVPNVDVNENGELKFTVSSDRLRPTSKDDQTAPTIVIAPSIKPTTTASGLDLFNGAFNFAMTVTDGKEDPRNSGIREVVWTVEDKNGVVAGYEKVETYDNYTLAKDYTIDIPLAVAKGESNDVKLTITAMDNVGNTIVYEKTFGVDNWAPRVTITQSNHDVRNDFYFKENQVITVTIEDLNFEPTTSSVTTEVSFNGWQELGENKYRTVLTYNRDGDYTFAMATKDRANNDAVIDYTTGLTALQKFTIDKTAPIINVTFNPAVAVDRDPAGVQYFDKDRSVTATITEHNFRASDVRSDLGARNSLSAWRSNGDTHTAGELFTEGNNYKVSIQYTDLAGNPAESYTSPTFSVDTGEPTITINGGMSEGKLNIVPGDLDLDFTINDEESNLKSLDVEVIFLDSNFNQTKVEGAAYYTFADENSRTTRYINFANIEAIKANDGIYTVRVTAVDYAGHVVTLMSDLVFSLNRFGSTFYAYGDYTKSFLTTDEEGTIYRSDVEEDLVIKEINPNRVWQDADKKEEGSLITVSVNGQVKALKEGEDYQMDVKEKGLGTSKWFEYTYQISKDVFRNGGELVDGEYTILFYSEDDAANKNTNERNEGSSLTLGSDGSYNGKIVFTLDHKAPVVTILGISNGQNIFEKNQSVEINIADNTTVFVEVYINDQKVEEVKVDVGQPVDSDWLYYDAATGTYKMNMSEKHVPQNISIVVKDAAGNQITEERTDIMLTENLWYQYINSTPAKIATVVIALALFMLIMILIKKRKQKKEAEAAAAKI